MHLDRFLSLLIGSLSNHGQEHAKQHVVKLVGSAKDRVQMVVGELDSFVFADPDVLSAMEKVTLRANNPASVEIIVGPSYDTEVAATLLALSPRIHLYKAPNRPRAHFLVVDGRDIRIEEYHEPGSQERDAFVKYSTLVLGNKLEADFRKAKAASGVKPVEALS